MSTATAPVVRDAVAAVAEQNDDWLRRYAFRLVLLDALLLGVVGIVSVLLRFGTGAVGDGALMGDVSYFLIAGLLSSAWLAMLGLSRCYETRFLGTGTEEYRRVGEASIRLMALTALMAYSFQLDIARGFGAPFLVLGTLALLAGRAGARAVLRAGRRKGRWTHRVLVVGNRRQAEELAEELCRDPVAGYQVVGACLPGGSDAPLVLRNGSSVPVLGALGNVTHALLTARADTVAIAGSQQITGEALRRLSYQLEGTGVDLLVAPALTNVTGTRVSIRPVAGLPLLHLDEPELSGARKFVKYVFDFSLALVLVILLAPLLLGIAVAVRVSSRGRALFTQQRVGRDGRLFRVYKFRSMHVDAEQRLADLRHLNEHDGVLFKVRDDPRTTRLGRWLRKYSLDELPQLFNVLKGDMSLVGPRPPLPTEVERYEGHARRRLLVRPGITGLWQVSGRSDLSWEDTVRLDLHYVENWSLGLDIGILAKTASAVLAGKGAY